MIAFSTGVDCVVVDGSVVDGSVVDGVVVDGVVVDGLVMDGLVMDAVIEVDALVVVVVEVVGELSLVHVSIVECSETLSVEPSVKDLVSLAGSSSTKAS